MRGVDYDAVAPSYDRRYSENDSSHIANALLEFVGDHESTRVLEVGCGTGHWLALLADRSARIAGIDPSRGMLRKATMAVPSASVVLGRAEALPWSDGAFDRVFCINAFHHFIDKEAFLLEACRVLRRGGGVMTVGLDPHTGIDRWWIYDYFHEAWEIDKERYPPAEGIRAMMAVSGLSRCETRLAQHMPRELAASEALDRGLVDKNRTSQLTVLTEDEYERGMGRLRRKLEAHRAEGKQLRLTTDLRLYATTGWVA